MSLYFKKDGFPGQKHWIIPYGIRKGAQDDSICKWVYVVALGYFPKAQYHLIERKRGSNDFILMYCVSGKGTFIINKIEYTLMANQVVIFPAGIAHKYEAHLTEPWTIYWIHFTGMNAEALSNYILGKEFRGPLDVPFDNERNKVFDQMYSYAEGANNQGKFINLSLSLTYYLASFTEASSLYRNLKHQKDGPVEMSIKFMKDNLASTFTLKYLAELVSLSVSHYSTLFQQKTHKSPLNYFTHLKMQHACNLLDFTEFSVKRIGLELGYADAFHFSRTFKQGIGVSPKNFRNRD